MAGLKDETGTSALILDEYVDALVAGEDPSEERFLKHAPGVDLEALKMLFWFAGKVRDSVLTNQPSIPEEELVEDIWGAIAILLRYECWWTLMMNLYSQPEP